MELLLMDMFCGASNVFVEMDTKTRGECIENMIWGDNKTFQ